LLALLQEPSGPPKLIEIPEPSPATAARIRQMEERKEREVGAASGRAYAHRPDLRPLASADLAPNDRAWLADLSAEWSAWHEQHADTWRPDGGELDVAGLRCIGPADLLPYEPIDRYADTWEVCP
jgi:hypothetical protein